MFTPENYKSVLANDNQALKIHIMKNGFENVEPGWVTRIIDDLKRAKQSEDNQKELADSYEGQVNLLSEYNRKLRDSIGEYRFFMWCMFVFMIVAVGGSLVYNIAK